MSILQIKIHQKGRSITCTWRPGQAGSWLLTSNLIEHGDLTVRLSKKGGKVEVKIFKGGCQRPLCRQVLGKEGTYAILGARKIMRM